MGYDRVTITILTKWATTKNCSKTLLTELFTINWLGVCLRPPRQQSRLSSVSPTPGKSFPTLYRQVPHLIQRPMRCHWAQRSSPFGPSSSSDGEQEK